MGRMSDKAMDQQQEGVDELLCEIDHLKGRAIEADKLILEGAEWMDAVLSIFADFDVLEISGNSLPHLKDQVAVHRAFLEAKP